MENDELHGKPAEHIAAAIVKAAAVNHPKPLYPVDISYKAAVLLFRFLPIRLANYIVGKLYAWPETFTHYLNHPENIPLLGRN